LSARLSSLGLLAAAGWHCRLVRWHDSIRYDGFVNGELSDVQVGTGARSINYGNFRETNTVEVIAVDEAGNKSAPATLTFLLD
jgi:hypothetical protein